VRADAGGFWTPNGMHRLEAMRRLGAKSIVVLLVPEVELAYRILALNTEKAHNLKDKSLEVVRMADALAEAGQGKRPESDWAFEFEEPAYLTIGRAYVERPRYSGGAYMPVVRRCEEFMEKPLRAANDLRAKRAARLIELDDKVAELVAALKEAGLKSAYLKPFVVARLNPLRFVPAARGKKKAESGPADFDKTLDQMLSRGEKFDASKVRPQDLAQMGGAPPESED
jgi:ParB family chromosome partitioning protein